MSSPSRGTGKQALLVLFPLLFFAGFLVAFQSYKFAASQEHLSATQSQKKASTANNFDKLLPRLQNHLCPNQQPNLKYIQDLTRLAWEQLQDRNSSSSLYEWNRNLGKLIWRFDFGWSLYIPPHAKQALVYRRIYKCANNEIRGWMERVLVPEGGQYRATIWDPKIQEKMPKVTTLFPPCIITAIRDPIAHFLSGYNEMENRRGAKQRQQIQQMFAKSVENSTAFFWFEQDPQARFGSFVRNLLEGHTLIGSYPAVEHVFPMMRILSRSKEFNLSLSGYLPSLKNLSLAWPRFVQETCPDAMPESIDLVQKTVNAMNASRNETYSFSKGHKSSSDPHGTYAAAKKVWTQQEDVARALCIWHVMDYACWPALEGVPSLCQSTFMSALPKVLPESLWHEE